MLHKSINSMSIYVWLSFCMLARFYNECFSVLYMNNVLVHQQNPRKIYLKKIKVFSGNLILTQTHGVLNFSNYILYLLIMKNVSKRKHSSFYNIQWLHFPYPKDIEIRKKKSRKHLKCCCIFFCFKSDIEVLQFKKTRYWICGCLFCLIS